MILFGTSVWWIALALIAYMIIGATWYSPLLFARPWMKALGKTKGRMAAPGPAMAITLVSELIIVLTLAYLVHALNIHDAAAGAFLALKLWFGIAATTALINRLFQGLQFTLYAIDLGYHLTGMVIAGAIIAL